MSKLVKTCRIGLLGLLLSCTHVRVAVALPVDDRELGRWVPSFSLIAGLNAQRVEGHLQTTDVLGPQDTDPIGANPAQPILPESPVTERTRMMTPYVGGSLELMTPAWKSLPASPRAYVRGDLAFAFGPEYNIPNIRDPGPFRVSPGIPGGLTEGAILGQGGFTSAEVEPLLIMAGAGLAFTFDVRDRALRLKTSVEYIREEIRVTGLVRRAVALANSSPDLSGFRPITLAGENTFVYNGLGPGVEVEIDTSRAGPFVLSLYLAVKGWRFLDNEKRFLSDTNEWGESATWTFLKNDWAFGGNLGLRFRWIPE